MSFNKVLFIGLGGAGQRHLRVLSRLLPKNTIFSTCRTKGTTPLLRPDFTVEAEGSIEATYNLQTFKSLDLAFADKPNLTVISTPTSCHRDSILMAIEAGSGVLVEKPWAENLMGFSKFRNDIANKKLPFLISFQRRFHPQILSTKEAISSNVIGRPIAATFTTFSNVPNWHTYEDWRGLYAVRADMGGGVLLTEIHEIDLANYFFGPPISVFCNGGNRGVEVLSIEDTVQMTLLYANFSVQITLCFMHKKPMRNFHIVGTDGEISWEETSQTLNVFDFNKSSEIRSKVNITNEDMFEFQANKFINNWSIDDTNISLSAAAISLAIVEAAKKSMKSGCAELLSDCLDYKEAENE